MNRSMQLLTALTATLLFPLTASALGLSIVSVSGAGADGVLEPGETVTFELVMENLGAETLYGAEAVVNGYDLPDAPGLRQLGLELQSGASSARAFGIEVPGVGYFGGLDNIYPAPEEIFFVNNLNPVAWTTTLFGGVSLSPTSGTGLDDTGINGNLIADGDVHFRATFVANPTRVASSTFTMNFDLNAIGFGGALLPSTGDQFTLTVIPEPGTALLMGLGLAGLATRRRIA